MLALVAIASGIVLGFAIGGDLRGLSHARFVGGTLVLGVFVAQALFRGPLLPLFGALAIPLWGACSLVLLVLLSRQLATPGLPAAALGVAANALVVLLNGGMPVSASSGSAMAAARAVQSSAGFYHFADNRTVAAALGDVLPVSHGIASLGDVLLAVGVCVYIASQMHPDG